MFKSTQRVNFQTQKSMVINKYFLKYYINAYLMNKHKVFIIWSKQDEDTAIFLSIYIPIISMKYYGSFSL